VADDDPASRRFLCDGLQSLGASVESCADGTTALSRAQAENFDLLLLDCRMPGAGALQILASLREDPQAASCDSVAVATSAELETEVRQSLLSAGFDDTLLKPCGLADLQQILALAQPGRQRTLLLDDSIALSTSGDETTMRALRSLLRDELAQLDRELDSLSHDHAGFAERLHRLRSSCGFCGASALSSRIAPLQRQLVQDGQPAVSLTRFRSALRATMQALDR
jgi:CheY-like chemotaxis protein/HPt (histidine-containing phosphotransfer) domain-containing protein